MLGILIPYHSFFEMLDFQVKNIRHFVHADYKILVIDDSDEENSPLQSLCKEFTIEFWKISPQQHKLYGDHPSARHQHALNTGLELLRETCTHILIFDNDMVFTEHFTPVLDNQIWYLPQVRGTLQYPWLNLFLFPLDDIEFFDFAMCPETQETTDPGGNLAEFLKKNEYRCHFIQQEWSSNKYFLEYQKKYLELTSNYSVQAWYDIFHFGETSVFHFRGLSNWQKHPEEFLAKKKELILEQLILFQNTYLN